MTEAEWVKLQRKWREEANNAPLKSTRSLDGWVKLLKERTSK